MCVVRKWQLPNVSKAFALADCLLSFNMTADGHGKYFIRRAESLAAICIYHQEAAREAGEALRKTDKTEQTEPLCLYFVLK